MGKFRIGFTIDFEYDELEDLSESYIKQLSQGIDLFNGSIGGVNKKTGLKLPKVFSKGLPKKIKDKDEVSLRDKFRQLGFILLEEKLGKDNINYSVQTKALNLLYDKLNGNFDTVRSKYLELYASNKLCDMYHVYWKLKGNGVDGTDRDTFLRRRPDLEQLKGK